MVVATRTSLLIRNHTRLWNILTIASLKPSEPNIEKHELLDKKHHQHGHCACKGDKAFPLITRVNVNEVKKSNLWLTAPKGATPVN